MWDVFVGVLIGLLLWILLVSVMAYIWFFGISIIKWKTLDECPFLIPVKEVGLLLHG